MKQKAGPREASAEQVIKDNMTSSSQRAGALSQGLNNGIDLIVMASTGE